MIDAYVGTSLSGRRFYFIRCRFTYIYYLSSSLSNILAACYVMYLIWDAIIYMYVWHVNVYWELSCNLWLLRCRKIGKECNFVGGLHVPGERTLISLIDVISFWTKQSALRLKNITDVIDGNLKKDYPITIIFSTNIDDTLAIKWLLAFPPNPTSALHYLGKAE